MAEPTLTQALSSVLGAAVPSGARPALLAAVLGRGRVEQRNAVVIPLLPPAQVPGSVAPERPAAA